MRRLYKQKNGFWKFAFLPTRMVSGETVWLKYFFVAGEKHGAKNRYSIGSKRLELKYSKESARLSKKLLDKP